MLWWQEVVGDATLQGGNAPRATEVATNEEIRGVRNEYVVLAL